MGMIEINKNPSRRDLAWFGFVLLIFLVMVGYMVGRITASTRVSQAIWALGGILTLVYYAIPPVRRMIFVGWMYLAYPIGYVVSHLLLGLIYFGLMTPVGLLLRMFGHDAMSRRFDPTAGSYWVKKDAQTDVSRYFRQF